MVQSSLRIAILVLATAFVCSCSSGGGGSSAITSTTTTGTPVAFTDTDGVLTTVEAVPGEVIVFSAGGAESADTVRGAITANGGTILRELPARGLYTVSVAPGTEASFIAALRASTGIRDLSPNLVLTPQGAAMKVLDTAGFRASQAKCPDASNGGPVSHGEAVARIAGRDSFEDVATSSSSEVAVKIADVIDGTSGPQVINVSIGREDVAGQSTFLNQVATVLDHGGSDISNTVVVIASGNGGNDIGPALRKLFDKHPDLAGHLVLVGSSGKKGDCTIEKNGRNVADSVKDDARGNPLMVYAPGEDVEVPGREANCKPSGTSFAAPQVAKALRDALDARTAGQSVADAVKKYMKDKPLGPDCDTQSGCTTCAACDQQSAVGVKATFSQASANCDTSPFASSQFGTPSQPGLTIGDKPRKFVLLIPSLAPGTYTPGGSVFLGYTQDGQTDQARGWRADSGSITIRARTGGGSCLEVKGAVMVPQGDGQSTGTFVLDLSGRFQ